MMRLGTPWLLVFLLMASTAVAQLLPVSPSGPRTVLRGALVDAAAGVPLVRARVDVISAAQLVGTVMTDEGGEFSASVPANRNLSIRVVKAGYAVVRHQVRPEQLNGVEPLVVQVSRGAVINGRVVTAAGEMPPMTAVMLRPLSDAGVPDGENSQSLQTDERGEFRFGGLPAGRYILESSSSLAARGPARGVVIELAAGAEAGVDVVFIPGDEVAPLPLPEGGGSTIRGTVTTMRGVPLADARVFARQNGGRGSATTDMTGRFAISGLSPGPATISATKRGYIALVSGPLQVPTVTVESGRDVDNVSLVLVRASVVTGTVVDERGEPLQDAGVQLLRVRRSAAGLVAIRDQVVPLRTDDRGQFRMSYITPGEYLLTATLPPAGVDAIAGPRTAYVPAFYPDTHDVASAAPIRIGHEDDIAGVVLTVRRVPVLRVAGVVANSEGSTFIGTVRLVPRSSGLVAPEARAVRPNDAGEFVFGDVTPGDYVVQAFASSVPSGPEFASMPITVVDRDPEPVRMRTSTGSSLSGRLVLEGGAGELLWGYSFSSTPMDRSVSTPASSSSSAPMGDGETFTFRGLTGLTRLNLWSNDANWYLKSILINGFDAADVPFDFGFDGREYNDVEVVFSRAAASLTGRATDDRARPIADYAVYVFATDRDKWVAGSRWLKVVRPGADGTFKATALPPGDYWVAAVDLAEAASAAADWIDSDRLDGLALRATRVALGEQQSSDVTLRMVRP